LLIREQRPRDVGGAPGAEQFAQRGPVWVILVDVEGQQRLTAAAGQLDARGQLHAERLELAPLFRARAQADPMHDPHRPDASEIAETSLVVIGRPTQLAQPKLPRLRHEVAPEAMVRLGRDELEAGLLVEVPRGDEDVVRPQRDAIVAGLAGETDALGDQATADPQAARPRLDEEEAQLRDAVRVADQEHRADVLSVALGDPAALAAR